MKRDGRGNDERGGDEALRALAEAMMRDARAHPGDVIRPLRPLGNGAHLVMKFGAGMFWLRVGRKGLSPENDFSRESGKRKKLWDIEVRTFLRAFGVSSDAQHGIEVDIAQGADGLFYFADCIWQAPSMELGASPARVARRGNKELGGMTPPLQINGGMRK